MKKNYIFLVLIVAFSLMALNINAQQCQISSIQGINASQCNDNNTPKDLSDDWFTVDVLVKFTNLSQQANLILHCASLYGTKEEKSPLLTSSSSSYTFTGLKMKADGNSINVDTYLATNSRTLCTLTKSIGTAPHSCGQIDTDSDGIFDNNDSDIDGDGVLNIDEGCGKGLIDIGVLIDGSNSIGSGVFNSYIRNIAVAIYSKIPRDNSVRLTVIEFGGDNPILRISPTIINSNNITSVYNNIISTPYLDTSTYLEPGIDLFIKSISNLPTSNRKVINIVTDGDFSEKSDTDKDSGLIKKINQLKTGNVDALNILYIESYAIRDFSYQDKVKRDIVFPQPEGGLNGFYTKIDNFTQVQVAFAKTLETVLSTAVAIDSDLDGIANCLDIDSDNDGISDNIESQAITSYIPPIGRDTDKDGIDDAYDTDNSGKTIYPINTDGDKNPDYIDIDSDNDGIPDNVEGQATSNYKAPSKVDKDKDGLDDVYDAGNTGINPVDTDNDNVPDYRDLDTDNDDTHDINENGSTNTLTGVDSDQDGLDNAFDQVFGFDPNDEITHSGTQELVASFGDDNQNVDTQNNIAKPLKKDLNFREAICYRSNLSTIKTKPSSTWIIGGNPSKNYNQIRSNAQLVIDSNTGGLVVPRISSPETSIHEPKDGMIIFDTDDNCLKLYKNKLWGCLDQDCVK